MPRPLDGAVGERMELGVYYADFQENYVRAHDFWKLERGQVFAEPGDESWEAFDHGDWDEAMSLLEEAIATMHVADCWAATGRENAAREQATQALGLMREFADDRALALRADLQARLTRSDRSCE
jgi:hypothetical protein